jgi:tetratricopeptide (TPR) repeat protein
MLTWIVAILFLPSMQPRAIDSTAKKPDLAAVLEIMPGDYTAVKPEEVIKLCSEALTKEGSLAPSVKALLYHVRGDAYYELEKYSDARKDYDKWVRMCPQDPTARLRRGQTLSCLGLEDLAIEDYRAALRLQPKSGEAYLGLSLSLYMSSQLSISALSKYLDKAIELDPNYAGVYYNRAIARGVRFQFVDALKDLDKCIILDPRSSKGKGSVYAARAIVLAYLDKLDAGLRNAQVACQLSPSSPHERMALWLCYYNAGKYHIAQRIAEEITRLHPKYYYGYQAYSATQLAEGRLKEAFELAQKAVSLVSVHDPTTLSQLGNVYLEMRKFAKAKNCFEKELASDIPNNPFALAGEAYLLSACPDKQFRDGRKALALAERASRCFHDKHPRYVMLRAMAHAECGEFGKAVELAKLALKLCRPDFDFRPQYERLLHQFERRVPHRWVQGCKTFDFFRY